MLAGRLHAHHLVGVQRRIGGKRIRLVKSGKRLFRPIRRQENFAEQVVRLVGAGQRFAVGAAPFEQRFLQTRVESVIVRMFQRIDDLGEGVGRLLRLAGEIGEPADFHQQHDVAGRLLVCLQRTRLRAQTPAPYRTLAGR